MELLNFDDKTLNRELLNEILDRYSKNQRKFTNLEKRKKQIKYLKEQKNKLFYSFTKHFNHNNIFLILKNYL